MKTIEDMYAGAWNEAIKEVAEIINEETGSNLLNVRDWVTIENIASRLGVRFNLNGEIERGQK